MLPAAFCAAAVSCFPQPCMCSSPPRRRRLLRQVAGAAIAGAASLLLQATKPPQDLSYAAIVDPTPTVAKSPAGVWLWPRAAPQALIPRPKRRPVRPAPPITAEVEFQMLSRMGVAIVCGAIIGIERRAASANAGIRTLSLVSLGSAIFSLTSLHGLGGDPARMGAAISTGIGFLGSGAIYGDNRGGRRQLVTAASIWIAAALGVAAASGLYSMAVMGAIVTVWILRWKLMHKLVSMIVVHQVEQFKQWLPFPRGKTSASETSEVEDKEEAEVDYDPWRR